MTIKIKPYADEIAALKNELKVRRARQRQCAREQKYSCVLSFTRTRLVWSDFGKKMCKYTTSYTIGLKTKIETGNVYNYGNIHITQDPSSMWRLSVEDAVALSRNLPIETTICWIPGDPSPKEKS